MSITSVADASETGPVSGGFTVTRTGDLTFGLDVKYTVAGTANSDPMNGDVDYGALMGYDFGTMEGWFNIPAMSSSTVVSIDPYLDTLVEGNETVVMTLLGDAAYTLGSPVIDTVNIADAPVPSVSITSVADASETGPVSGGFTVTRTGDLTFGLDVKYTVAGTANSDPMNGDVDYGALMGYDFGTMEGWFNIPAMSSSTVVSIDPYLDTLVEGNETVVMTLLGDAAYTLGSPVIDTVNIADAPVPSVSITSVAHASETDGMGPVPGGFTVTRTGDLTFDLNVKYTIVGTANSDPMNGDVDYSALPAYDFTLDEGWFTIPAMQSTATISVDPFADALIEGTETVIMTLLSDSAYIFGAVITNTVNITDAPTPIVGLTIYNGQGVATPVADAVEETLGAFTVTNWNDSDNDNVQDDADWDGVAGEVDLMRLIVKKPAAAIMGFLTLTVSPTASLWFESSKDNQLPIDDSQAAYLDASDFAAGDVELWVEITSPSTLVRDVDIVADYQGLTDRVTATGIWSEMDEMYTDGARSTATSGSGNQIVVASGAEFTAGNWVHIFDDGSWQHHVIVNVTGNTLLLDDNLETSINGGEIVRQGYWEEVNKSNMLLSFEQRGNIPGFGGADVDGAFLGVRSHFYNSMAMRFVLTPAGIGDVIKNHPASGIVVDITRQREEFGFQLATPTTEPIQVGDESFPTGDIPNDDSPFNGQQDEDTDLFVTDTGTVLDYVFSRDMPGKKTENTGGIHQWVFRWNFKEFVRIKLNGQAFANQNDVVEGSRSSFKSLWHSRMDLVDDGNGVWERNPMFTATGNLIGEGHIDLGTMP